MDKTYRRTESLLRGVQSVGLLPIYSALRSSEIYPIVSNRNDKALLDTLAKGRLWSTDHRKRARGASKFSVYLSHSLSLPIFLLSHSLTLSFSLGRPPAWPGPLHSQSLNMYFETRVDGALVGECQLFLE